MQSRVLQRKAWAAVLVLALGVAAVSTAAAKPVRPGPRATSAFNLFAGSVNLLLVGNRVNCNITNFGNICINPYGSGTIESGFWPAGTPDNYVFNTGLQVGGTVYYDPAVNGVSTGPWVGDTVGVFFMDPRGPQRMGSPITNVYSGLSASDLDAWPSAGYIQDTSLYNASLLGQKTISQQDTWVRYWDGDPNIGSGRKHPMGMLVEQRGLLWNTVGQEDILYFLFRFINITATDPTMYAGLANAGYTTPQINDIVGIAQDFHNRMLGTFGVTLPDKGYTFHNTFAAIFQDPDLGPADHNYSTAILPFNITAVIQSNYNVPQFTYPVDVFSPPFAAAPGFEGVKYLKSPVNPATGRQFGITVWGNTTNGPGFPDAVGVSQMYRYISGQVRPALGDGSCNSDPVLLHTCNAVQAYADTRFFMASGPFDLAPGQSSVIVVALIFAAPLASMPATTNGIYAMPAFTLSNYITTTDFSFVPGWPAMPETLAVRGANVCTTACTSTNTIRDPVERPMGWGQFSDKNNDGRIDQTEVDTPNRSLLAKAKTAQLIFDNKFLAPFAPAAPDFFLIPGDGQVSIMWKKSATETAGDPYFAVASNPTSALYDPNYRQIDVEGYRVWRGRTASEMQLLAQFDYQGTNFIDYTGHVFNSAYTDPSTGAYQCDPDLGIYTTCPADFSTLQPWPTPLVGNVIQLRSGDCCRKLLADGTILIVKADTAVTGGNSGYPPLTDNLVPFAYVDNTVRNGFQYFYSVTAFDVNSFVSGSSSLQSSMVTKSVVPHASSGQETAGALGATVMLGAKGDTLNTSAALPTIDPTTGIFSGPMPPANGGLLGFMAFIPQVLAAGSGSLTVTIDSVIGGDAWDAIPGTYYVTVQGAGKPQHLAVPFQTDLTNVSDTAYFAFAAQPDNSAKASRYGGDTTYALYGKLIAANPGTWRLGGWGRGYANGNNSLYNGPRWWSGAANENTPNPNGGFCDVFNNPGCRSQPHTAGALAGVDSLFYVAAYTSVQSSPKRYLEGHTSSLHRAADFNVYWGAAGVVDSVTDVTHHVKVPFSPAMGATWGILNDSSFLGRVDSTKTRDRRNSILTWSDIFCVHPWADSIGPAGFGPGNACGGPVLANTAVFMNHARLSPVYANGGSYAATSTRAATGNGFIFYINGEFFVMQMTALPTNTVWHYRDYAGRILGDSATASFAFRSSTRPIAVPGLRFQISYQGSTVTTTTTDSLFARIHTVPDPYYVTNSLETSANNKVLRFVNLPSQAIVRIYSASGILVRLLTHNDAANGSELSWDLRNRNNQFVASGVYFYHVEAADGRTKIGRFTVVNFAQ